MYTAQFEERVVRTVKVNDSTRQKTYERNARALSEDTKLANKPIKKRRKLKIYLPPQDWFFTK